MKPKIRGGQRTRLTVANRRLHKQPEPPRMNHGEMLRHFLSPAIDQACMQMDEKAFTEALRNG